jgi:hypothetical protein
LAALPPRAARAADPSDPAHDERSSKLTVRVSNGLLSNSGSQGGSDFSLGGLNLAYSYFITGKVAVGLGYRADFDFSSGILPLSGIDLPIRYYFGRRGTMVTERTPEITSTFRPLTSFYAGGQVSRQEYFLGQSSADANGVTVTGTFASIDALAGIDYAISRSFELNAEISSGLFTFAASDPAFRIRATLLKLGISFVF